MSFLGKYVSAGTIPDNYWTQGLVIRESADHLDLLCQDGEIVQCFPAAVVVTSLLPGIAEWVQAECQKRSIQVSE